MPSRRAPGSRSLTLQNKEVLYNLLFRATAETLNEVAAGWKDLKAKIGFFAILHSWGQKLDFHPHLHCVAPGGGISLDGTRCSDSLSTNGLLKLCGVKVDKLHQVCLSSL